MAQEVPETTYEPEVEEDARRKRERRVVQEGTALWRRRKEELQRQKHREQREGWTSNSTIDRLYKRNTDPPAVVDVNKFYDDRATPGIASETQPDPRNLYKEEVQVYELTGGVELVPLLTSRRHQSYPQSRRYLATDATRPGYTIESFRALGVGNREYIADLAEQIRRKRDRALEERRIEQESCRRHFDTWRRLWGRPGHGAPIDHARRNNLYNILHRPAIY
ncbi:PREDICTED: uncharacterized protein LOC105566376 isoform X2 [Vollenhovia emeryi]|uniref:uncharacterized protein LOC105566376 isoform X2 n=1 Tax=Vollenhovia emeryi TaxID=411798 RepID=UPI0005F38194|nr:PREDICTED: uncharacterized protein LOC105566376 isoform X2 [Vollenhovia emeryi]